MALKTFWLSYDLGLKGDYTGMYSWLDTLGAKECGDSLAVLKLEISSSDPLQMLLRELSEHVTLNKTDRIYVIYRDDATGLNKGKFLVGGRKRAPWEGYAADVHEVTEDY